MISDQEFLNISLDKNGKQLRPSERLRADHYLLTLVWHREVL